MCRGGLCRGCTAKAHHLLMLQLHNGHICAQNLVYRYRYSTNPDSTTDEWVWRHPEALNYTSLWVPTWAWGGYGHTHNSVHP